MSVITHPANQLVGRRPGYDMDYPAIYAAAAETGTALEIDGAPSHLDLSGERAREAVQAGATVVIDSDCHRSRWLDRQMRMGVATARRGWVEPGHVLNTRSARRRPRLHRPQAQPVNRLAARKRGRCIAFARNCTPAAPPAVALGDGGATLGSACLCFAGDVHE